VGGGLRAGSHDPVLADAGRRHDERLIRQNEKHWQLSVVGSFAGRARSIVQASPCFPGGRRFLRELLIGRAVDVHGGGRKEGVSLLGDSVGRRAVRRGGTTTIGNVPNGTLGSCKPAQDLAGAGLLIRATGSGSFIASPVLAAIPAATTVGPPATFSLSSPRGETMPENQFVVLFKRRHASTWVKSAVYWRTLEQAERVCAELRRKGYKAVVEDEAITIKVSTEPS
jgi:hypothetical protein